MSTEISGEAFVWHLFTQIQQITGLLSSVDTRLIALEKSLSTQKQIEGRQLRSAPKSQRQRLDQLVNQIEQYMSQTQAIFEQLLKRVGTFKDVPLPSDLSTAYTALSKADDIVAEAVYSSKYSGVRVKGDLNEGNTTNTTIEDKAQAFSQIAATTTTPKDTLDTQKLSDEQIPPQPVLSHDRSNKPTSVLRYLCKSSQLFRNMASTTQKALDFSLDGRRHPLTKR